MSPEASTAPGVNLGLSRQMWETLERFHGICYLAPEVREEATNAGLKGFWMNYFATRIAPVGPVGPAVVADTFFYYGPARVERAIPDAWEFADPVAIIDARYRGMDRALRRLFGDQVDGLEMSEAAELATHALTGLDPIGRVLASAWAALGQPAGSAALRLWHATTVLREYRSGNHLIAVCSERLDGCQAVVSHVAAGGAPAVWIRDEAGWTAEDEASAVAALTGRGWLDADGRITPEGAAGRVRLETLTDDLDAPVWERLGETESRRLQELVGQFGAVLEPDDQLDWRTVYREEPCPG